MAVAGLLRRDERLGARSRQAGKGPGRGISRVDSNLSRYGADDGGLRYHGKGRSRSSTAPSKLCDIVGRPIGNRVSRPGCR